MNSVIDFSESLLAWPIQRSREWKEELMIDIAEYYRSKSLGMH